MVKPNLNYAQLKESYLFAGIAKKTKQYLEENPDNRVQYFRRRTGTSVYVKLSTRSEFDDIKAGNMKEIKNFPKPVENCKLEEIKKEFNKWE